MGIRLLPKNELDHAKAAEQKRIIDEGIKIARKVDGLREVRAEEEAALLKWRSDTLEIIGNEIKSAIERRDIITQQAEEAETRRISALKPLDDERNRIIAEGKLVTSRGEEIDRRLQVIEGRENTTTELFKRAETLQRDAELNNAVSNTRFQEAYNAKREAERLLASAEERFSVVDRHRRNVEVELTHREKNVANRESRATLIETEQNARETALNARETLLKDREAMVERDFKRTKK